MAERAASAPVPAGAPWPASATFGSGGLTIGGVPAEVLATRYGTPLLVVDVADVRARAAAAATAFARALYAVKAFTSHAVIRVVMDAGMDLLAASGGEVEACLRAGAPASRIVMHGNNKSDDELELAVTAGLSLVVADGAGELERLGAVAARAGVIQPVLLRIVPGVEVDTHASIATGHLGSKFGTPPASAVQVVEACLGHAGLRFDGLHAHVGSQVSDIAPFLEAVDALVEVSSRLQAELGAEVATLDLGGGFAAATVDEPGLDPAIVAAVARDRLALRCARAGLREPALIGEPGRAIVADPVVTLYRVGETKRAAGRILAAVDGGMSDNLRPMLYGARFAVASAGPGRPGPPGRVTVVGKHCESGDVLASDAELPVDLGRGDLLAFAATGAYTYSMASSYNRVGRPAVVGVEEGIATPWLRREDPADMDRFETSAYRPVPTVRPLPDGIEVRLARASDAQAFLVFWRAIVSDGRFVRSERVAHPLRVYRRRFRRPPTDREAQYLAMENDRVVGHLYVQRESHPATRHVATLGIAVAADRRGRGIGTALMAEAHDWARASAVEKFVLSVYPHNTAAITLYRRFGFVDEGRLARQSRKSYGYEDEILMGAWIGPAQWTGPAHRERDDGR
jgi:diaminopimelate decarboxylase